MSDIKYIIAGNFIDGAGGEFKKNVCLVVKGDVIASIIPASEVKEAPSGNVVDLSHCTVLPPLVDCYSQLSLSSATAAKVRQVQQNAGTEETRSLIQQNIHYNHSHGVLGLVNFDDGRRHVAQFLANSGRSVAVSVANSSNENNNWRSMVLQSTNDQGTKRKSKIDEVAEITVGTKKVLIANGQAAVKKALAVGCDCLLQGYGMSTDQLQQLAEKNVLWIPNLMTAKALLSKVKNEDRKSAEILLKQQLFLIGSAKEYGVTAAIGTGAGSSGIIHGESVSEEVRLFQKSGYSLVEALKCGSINGAAFFGIDNIGLLQPGREATFLVTRGMTVQLPRKLTYLENIYYKGVPSKNYRKNPVKTVYKNNSR